MKVLYFSRDYTPHDFRFLKAICDNGDEAYYLRLETRNVYESRPLPDAVHIVEWRYGKEPFNINMEADNAVRELKKVFSELQPDVVHSGPLTDCSWLAAKADLHPHAAMSWGFDLGREIDTIPGAADRAGYALSKADWFLGDCYVELDKAVELGYGRDRSTIFPWGIDVDRFSPGEGRIREKISNGGDFLLLSLRTMEPNYDVETVVRGFLAAVRQEPGMRLNLLGDGSQMEKLKNIAENDSNGSRITFFGRQSNDLLVDYYRSSDLYVSASIVDGSSVSLLEAMGCGLPVLMSEIPGNLEWVEDGANGILFPTRDVEDLSEKIVFCCRNRDTIRKYSQNARKLITENADWEKNKLLIHEAYRKACGQ
ncbi:MAG: glycosyltransferase family 4 protein [Anaerolineaceae bacterium]|nr:glycosyltransferase family 4 protein [Anaerolineaceae bacterium]